MQTEKSSAPRFTLIIAVLLCGCASAPAIQRISSAPADCEFLGTIYTDQLGDQPAGAEAVKDLMAQAEKLGGDTLQCCEIGDDVTVALWTNKRTGETYISANRHFGRVYRCSANGGSGRSDAVTQFELAGR